MGKLWTGRFHKALDAAADDFNSSISFDSKMYRQDILGSIAHATMLGEKNIIDKSEAEKITKTLSEILEDIELGKLEIDMTAEDIHSFVEGELTARIGDTGKRLHTSRSRNDQVATDLRLYLRDEANEVVTLLNTLIKTITVIAENNKDTIMSGYTHLQRAQPITFAHYILAYGMMFKRDVSRVLDAAARMNYSPLGSCALAGTTYDIDRDLTASLLGFDGICENSLDGVSDRDFCLELMSAISIIMMHLSRLSEEIILFCSGEFSFIELDDSHTTGSSIMPQKKNPDLAELIRGKTGRVYGDLFTLLTVMKGIPLAYNKDMQEDKEAVFDSVETVKKCLEQMNAMLSSMTVKKDRLYAAAGHGYINATDLADYLTKKGIPFRTSYKLVGEIVAYAISKNATLEELTLDEYKKFSSDFDEKLFEAIDLRECVLRRTSVGGPTARSVDRQIAFLLC
ncbi:MAG: argininosuccinate lyase [Clostridia bacterium]|nr:argininosuccinate lyase [Clostridia bacterium]